MAVVGSINMDYRSMFLHFECGALLMDNSQVLALRDDVRATLPLCREVRLQEHRERGLLTRIVEMLLRVFSPLM